jgi:hypothetical protein
MLGHLSYVVHWPPIFAYAILPGVLVGSRIRTWRLSVIVTEVLTIGAVFASPVPLFGEWLFLIHLAVFPPLLVSILIGHFGARD